MFKNNHFRKILIFIFAAVVFFGGFGIGSYFAPPRVTQKVQAETPLKPFLIHTDRFQKIIGLFLSNYKGTKLHPFEPSAIDSIMRKLKSDGYFVMREKQDRLGYLQQLKKTGYTFANALEATVGYYERISNFVVYSGNLNNNDSHFWFDEFTYQLSEAQGITMGDPEDEKLWEGLTEIASLAFYQNASLPENCTQQDKLTLMEQIICSFSVGTIREKKDITPEAKRRIYQIPFFAEHYKVFENDENWHPEELETLDLIKELCERIAQTAIYTRTSLDSNVGAIIRAEIKAREKVEASGNLKTGASERTARKDVGGHGIAKLTKPVIYSYAGSEGQSFRVSTSKRLLMTTSIDLWGGHLKTKPSELRGDPLKNTIVLVETWLEKLEEYIGRDYLENYNIFLNREIIQGGRRCVGVHIPYIEFIFLDLENHKDIDTNRDIIVHEGLHGALPKFHGPITEAFNTYLTARFLENRGYSYTDFVALENIPYSLHSFFKSMFKQVYNEIELKKKRWPPGIPDLQSVDDFVKNPEHTPKDLDKVFGHGFYDTFNPKIESITKSARELSTIWATKEKVSIDDLNAKINEVTEMREELQLIADQWYSYIITY